MHIILIVFVSTQALEEYLVKIPAKSIVLDASNMLMERNLE
jgi:hypothetical protein